jgi:hypothetical protein
LIGIILGVLGILIGLWAAWWFARGPRLLYQASGASLITAPDDNSRISVQYDGEQVERVTQSIVWLWRRGRGAVKGEDVVPDDPITLSVPDGSVILDVAVLRQSVPTNNVTTDFQKDGGPAKSVTLGLAYSIAARAPRSRSTTRRHGRETCRSRARSSASRRASAAASRARRRTCR